jgi:hypothetical protein
MIRNVGAKVLKPDGAATYLLLLWMEIWLTQSWRADSLPVAWFMGSREHLKRRMKPD